MDPWVTIQKKRVGVFIISLSLLLFSSSFVYGQWDSVNPPSVSSAWDLYGVHFTSANEGWAVGYDWENQRGVLLHYEGGTWTSVTPPSVSPDWFLTGVHFTSANQGWAVGGATYGTNYIGVLLHYSGGTWTSVTPPSVTGDWDLMAVHFASANEGWAVGADYTDPNYNKGVLLHYSGGTLTSVTPPSASWDWRLEAVHFTSATEGWAVGWGYNGVNTIGGVLLHYSGGTWTSVTPPSVSTGYDVYGVHFTSANEGWAVGSANTIGVLLHYSGGTWTSVTPPSYSPRWELYGVHFASANEGWAVGDDWENEIGVLLHYSGGTWTLVTPPSVGLLSWVLMGVHLTSPTEGWAVGLGYDDQHETGILLKYFLTEDISTPGTPAGPFNGAIGTSYSYSTGGAVSNYGDPIQYLFDCGDGSNSGWLPVGKVTASKSWSSVGTYLVKVQARCSTHTSVVSLFSDVLTVNIQLPTIVLQSPPDGEIFNSCSLTTSHQPTFTWTPNGTFTKITILFSPSPTDFTAPIAKASIQPTNNSWIPSVGIWKKIMVSSNNNGSIRDIYWKVVGTMKDKTLWESGVMNISIDNPIPPQIQSPGDGDKLPPGTPPTFIFSTNCNSKFELDISSVSDFSDPKKIKKITYKIKDPNLTPGVQKTLSSSQWKAINKLIGTATGYFRVRAWDVLNRETISEIKSFTIQ